MANYFRDFMQPAKTVFDRLYQQKNQRVVINGNDGNKSANVIPPFYPNLPEYPCKLVRDAAGKVTEIQYGLDTMRAPNKRYVWRQIIHRGNDGKVDYIEQENPDGSFDITFHRNADNKVEIIDIE